MDRSQGRASVLNVLRGLALLALVGLLTGSGEERRSSPPTVQPVLAAPVAGHPPWRAVIDDWYDNGLFDRAHTCAAVRKAIDSLPRSMPRYSSIHGDISAYADLICAGVRRPHAPVTIDHRFEHPLPYPAGPRYSISLRAAGTPRGVRWTHFANDPSYVRSGTAGGMRFASVLLPLRRYVVTASLRPCIDVNDGCDTLGPPQARCARSIDVTRTRPIRIEAVARGQLACRISVTR